jgi:4-hydroxy-tetrahydrodipicolinate synthase
MDQPKGFYSFNITPTSDDGSRPDLDRLRRYIDYQIAEGASGMALFGSTGAVASFSESERMAVTEVALRHAAKRAPIIVGTGAMTTAEAERLSQHAEAHGAAAVFVVPMRYWPPEDSELSDHFAAIGASIRIPLGLYNNPFATNVDLKPDFIAKLARDVKNLTFIKESSMDVGRIREIVNLTGGKVRVFCGFEHLAIESFESGATGWFSGAGALHPGTFASIYELYMTANDPSAARARFQALQPLMAFITKRGTIRVAHAGLELLADGSDTPTDAWTRRRESSGTCSPARLRRNFRSCSTASFRAQSTCSGRELAAALVGDCLPFTCGAADRQLHRERQA